MQEEAKVPSVAAAKEKEPEVEMVQVRRPRRFAGETV
jgi:hypothetical protein